MTPDGVSWWLLGDATRHFEGRSFILVGVKMLQVPKRPHRALPGPAGDALPPSPHQLHHQPRELQPHDGRGLERPQRGLHLKALEGHTDSAEAVPSPTGRTSGSASAGTSSTPVTPWRGPRGRASYGSRAVTWWTGKPPEKQLRPPEQSGCPQPPQQPLRINYLCRKNLSPRPCSAHLSQTTSLSPFHPTPAQRG